MGVDRNYTGANEGGGTMILENKHLPDHAHYHFTNGFIANKCEETDFIFGSCYQPTTSVVDLDQSTVSTTHQPQPIEVIPRFHIVGYIIKCF